MKGRERLVVITAAYDTSKRSDITDAWRCAQAVRRILEEKGFLIDLAGIAKEDFSDVGSLLSKISHPNLAFVFNLFEGFNDDSFKEAEFARILEEANIAFSGNSSYTLSACLNKWDVRNALEANGIAVPRAITVKGSCDIHMPADFFPVFIKPIYEDASVGIDKYSLVTNPSDLPEVLEKKLTDFSAGLIVEEFIDGKEYNVGLLGQYPYEVIGMSVIDYSNYPQYLPFLTYDAKWDAACPEFRKIIPDVDIKLSQELTQRLVDIAKAVGQLFKCRGYFRVDLRERDGELFVLDVNPNPDINEDSGFIRQALQKGYGYKAVIEKIIDYSANSSFP
jgi:D-alanine-D-alanine ligase